MRFCCNDTGIGFHRDAAENEERLLRLKRIGFRVFGMSGAENATDDQIKQLKDLAAKHDMVPGMSPTGYHVVHPDPAERRRNQEGLKKALKNFGKMGVEIIHVCGGSYNGEDGWWHHPKNFTQEGLDELVTEMSKITPYAEDAGVCICPETTQWCILNSPERMKEYVDRLDSPYMKVTFDVTNHMRPDRIYSSGRFFRCVTATLGDRIGMFHVKDAQPVKGLVCHIDEVRMGTGILDHETFIKASNDLEPWKLFSLEHFKGKDAWENGYAYIQGIADRIGHTWSDPHCTRKWFEKNGEK